MRQGSDDFPNREIQVRAKDMETGEALTASLFVGFPHADIANAGLSAVVVTDGDRARAQRLCDELLDQAWRDRAAFVYRIEPLAQSIARAKGMTEGPVVLLDHYDNAASGGTMDTMTVLGAILEAGIENVAAFAVHDPEAVRRMIAAGIGAQVTLPLGGKLDMPAIGLKGEPLTVTGRVKLISEGRYRNRGPMATGVLVDMGPTVVLDTGRVEIVVISRHVEPNDVNCFLSLGIDPLAKRYLMLKSRVHWRAGSGTSPRRSSTAPEPASAPRTTASCASRRCGGRSTRSTSSTTEGDPDHAPRIPRRGAERAHQPLHRRCAPRRPALHLGRRAL
jgi:microcystin degradation protein MlrC